MWKLSKVQLLRSRVTFIPCLYFIYARKTKLRDRGNPPLSRQAQHLTGWWDKRNEKILCFQRNFCAFFSTCWPTPMAAVTPLYFLDKDVFIILKVDQILLFWFCIQAYRKWVREHWEEPRLPGVMLTNDQVFFISYARVRLAFNVIKSKFDKIPVHSPIYV